MFGESVIMTMKLGHPTRVFNSSISAYHQRPQTHYIRTLKISEKWYLIVHQKRCALSEMIFTNCTRPPAPIIQSQQPLYIVVQYSSMKCHQNYQSGLASKSRQQNVCILSEIVPSQPDDAIYNLGWAIKEFLKQLCLQTQGLANVNVFWVKLIGSYNS